MAIAYFHPEYMPEREHAWHLGCWLESGTEAWCVQELGTGRLMALYADKGDGLPQDERLPGHPSTVSFTALPETSTLVPESALVPGTELRHLKLVHGKVPTGLLRDEPVEAIGAHCIYLHDETAERSLTGRYPQARPVPLRSVLIRLGLEGNGSRLVLYRTRQRMDLVLADAGRLLLSNSWHATSKEDLLYYALFALEQCGMAPGQVELRTGGSHLNGAEEQLLGGYFAQMAPLRTLGGAGVEGGPGPEAHHWAALLEQYACV